MTKNLIFRIVACLLMAIVFTGTAFAGGKIREIPLDTEVLAGGQQCEPAPEGWRATWIASSDTLGEMMKRCGANRMDAGTGQLSEVDFDRYGVLAVEMGQRPSAGYGFETDSVTAQRSGEAVTVTLAHVRPAPGAMSAMVMTSPWILIRLPLDSYHAIRVVDPDGELLARTVRLQ